MSLKSVHVSTIEKQKQADEWELFLSQNKFDFSLISQIDWAGDVPVIYDRQQRKFKIDFINDRSNYGKVKKTMQSEILGRAVGAGKAGLDVVDLSAGLGVDSVFLCQLGFKVTAIERNPLIYLCLAHAAAITPDLPLKVVFADALDYLKKMHQGPSVFYFDPMFPQKTKSALPKQEMLFFKNLVGADLDADEVAAQVLKTPGFKRLAVKRPLAAPPLLQKPNGVLAGKLVRYDIYGVSA